MSLLSVIVIIVFLVCIAALGGVVLWMRAQAKHPITPPITDSELSQLRSEMPEDSQPQESEEFGMVPVLPQYQAVLRDKLTETDKARLLRLKRAADAVYNYFDWVASDFRRIDDTKHHTNRIEELLQDVMACLELSQFQKSLAGYFVVCVLTEIKEEFMASGPEGTMFPINIEALQEGIFTPEDVIDAVHQQPDHYTFYLAGIFVPEDYDIADLDAMTKAAISRGAVVYADDVLTTTNNLMDLVEAKYNKAYSDVDQEEHFAAFLEAIKSLYVYTPDTAVSAIPELRGAS